MAKPTTVDSVVTNPGGTGSSIIPTLSTHAADDVIEIFVGKTGNVTISAPANWTIKHQSTVGTSSNGLVGVLLYRRVLSTDTLPLPSPTISLGATVTRAAIALTKRGEDIESVYNSASWGATSTTTGSSNPIRPLSVTSVAPEMLVHHYYCQRAATNAPQPSGYTEDKEIIISGTLVLNVSEKNVADQATVLSSQDASPTSGARWVGMIACTPSIDYPYYRAGSQATTASGTTVTPTKPTGTTNSDQRGNKDVMIATVEGSGSTTLSAQDSGLWTEIGGAWSGTTSGGGSSVKKFWCHATATPNMQFNRTGTGEISACITTHYNCHQTNPIGNFDADARASSTTSTWDALNRLGAKVVVTTTCVADATPSFTSPTGWIERMDGLGISCADQTFNATGSTASASFTLSAGSPTLVGLVEILGLGAGLVSPANSSLSTTQFIPSLNLVTVPANSTLVVTTFAPSVVAGGGDVDVIPSTASLSLTSFSPQLKLDVIPNNASLAVTSFALKLDLQVTPNVLAHSLATFAPTVSIGTLAQPTPTELVLTTFAPSLKIVITPSTASLPVSVFAPLLEFSVIPDTANLLTTQFIPTLSLVIVPNVLTLTTTGFAPSTGQGFTLIPSMTNLATLSFAPQLSEALTPSTVALALNLFASNLDIAVRPTTQSVVIQSFSPNLKTAITPQIQNLTLTAFNLLLALGFVAIPSMTVLISSQFSPSLSLSVIPQTSSLALATFAPSLGGFALIPETLSASLTFYAPNVIAFAPRSVIKVSREDHAVRVSREVNVIYISEGT